MSTLLAATAAAASAWLMWGPRSPEGRLAKGTRVGNHARPAAVALMIIIGCLAVLGAVLLAYSGGLGRLAQGLTVAVLILTPVLVWRGRVAELRANRLRTEVVEACLVLTQGLHSGLVPSAALQQAAAECPVLAPAAAHDRIGGDPVRALLQQGRQRGGSGLIELAHGWTLIDRVGIAAGPLLQQISSSIETEAAIDIEVQAELAAPRLTGRMLAILPLAGLGIGFFVGGDPLDFLLSSFAGQLCLLGGVLLAGAGVLWSEHLGAAAQDRRPGQELAP